MTKDIPAATPLCVSKPSEAGAPSFPEPVSTSPAGDGHSSSELAFSASEPGAITSVPTTPEPNVAGHIVPGHYGLADVANSEVTDDLDTGDLDTSDEDSVTLLIWRGDQTGGDLVDYTLPSQPGEVVLDVVQRIQATVAPDLACRWNCKAGKCGSCSSEINGKPRLMCMTRVDELPAGPITVTPMRTFPIVRDLVTDVSFNYEVARRVPAFAPAPPPPGGYRMMQVDVMRGQEFRQCIECFLCQDVCHVIRDHEENKQYFAGPRFFARYAELEMHPLDTNDRRELLRQREGLKLCNVTKCCTEVCPEHIKITDNAIIPLKERVVDASYDPVAWLGRKILRRHKRSPDEATAAQS